MPRRRGTSDDKPASDPWKRVHIRVNTFTVDEWPIQESTSFEDLSIGAEQSISIVTALAWSPPGLAKHRRSVLAVLTSNLVVSLWASTSDPTVNENWQRILILHNAVQKSWERRSLSKHLTMPTGSSLARKLRVRSMAWAPQIRRRPEKSGNPVETRWGAFLLAVANEDGEIIILLTSSPYTTKSTAWDCKIVKSFFLSENEISNEFSILCNAAGYESDLVNRKSVPEPQSKEPFGDKPSGKDTDSATSRPSLFRSAMARKYFIDHIAWGPWNPDADAENVISLTCSAVVIHCVFRVAFQFPLNTAFSSVPRFYFKYMSRCARDGLDPADRPVAWQQNVSCSLSNRRE